MIKGFYRPIDINGSTRPSDTLPKSARETTQALLLSDADLEREMRRKMKNGLGRNVNGPTRPSVTLPKSASENSQVIEFIVFGFGEGLARGIFLHNEKRSLT